MLRVRASSASGSGPFASTVRKTTGKHSLTTEDPRPKNLKEASLGDCAEIRRPLFGLGAALRKT